MTHCQNLKVLQYRIYSIYMDIVIFALSNIKSQCKKAQKIHFIWQNINLEKHRLLKVRFKTELLTKYIFNTFLLKHS